MTEESEAAPWVETFPPADMTRDENRRTTLRVVPSWFSVP